MNAQNAAWNKLITSLNKPTEEKQQSDLKKIQKKEIRKYGYELKLDHGA